MVDYDKARDCEHGRQIGKCGDCEYQDLLGELSDLRAERDALKAELDAEKENHRLHAARLISEKILVSEQLEAAQKQEPVAYLHTLHMEFEQKSKRLCLPDEEDPFGQPGQDYSDCYPLTLEPLYASPGPAQQECTFHGADAQACMDYSKEVPCEFTWEQEAKLAFWHGWMLASDEKCDGHAEFISYIEKRKSELKGGENERE